MSTPEFREWPKIARYNRGAVVTEKIDGTNSAIIVTPDGVFAQSRKRIITPGKQTDNYGFAAWVRDNAEELSAGLGEGYHFGEWYGRGIQRSYGLDERRFALFNAKRWTENQTPPSCCSVVPIIWSGHFGEVPTADIIQWLRNEGSVAVPGFMRPEGIVIYHHHSDKAFKVTLEKDEEHKWESQAA